MPHSSKLPRVLVLHVYRTGDGCRTRERLSTFSLLALSVLAWLWSAPALACECAALSPADAYKQADAVFEGRVLELRSSPPGAWGQAAQRSVLLQVVRAWKGIHAEQVEITMAAQDAACSHDLAASQSYFVYAVEQAGHLSVGSCGRTRPMAEADEDVHVLGMGVTPVDPMAGAADPAKAPAKQPPARGGCASCAVGGTGSASRGSGPLLALLALGLFRLPTTYRRRSGSRS